MLQSFEFTTAKISDTGQISYFDLHSAGWRAIEIIRNLG